MRDMTWRNSFDKIVADQPDGELPAAMIPQYIEAAAKSVQDAENEWAEEYPGADLAYVVVSEDIAGLIKISGAHALCDEDGDMMMTAPLAYALAKRMMAVIYSP